MSLRTSCGCWPLVVAVAVAASGCSDIGESPPSVVRSDSAGVQLFFLRGDFLSTDTWKRLDPLWSVGTGTDGLFVDVAAATRTAAGSFAVLDRANRTVTLVGSEGKVLSSFGRRGDGPGEFQDPRDLVALEGTLVVWDLRQGAFHAFDQSGRFIRRSRLPEPGDFANLTGRIDLELEDLSRRMATTPAARAIFIQVEDNERELLDPEAREIEHVARSGFIIAYDPALSAGDTLVTYSAPTRSLSPATPSYGPPIFARQHSWDVGYPGLLHGSNDVPHLRLIDFSGNPLAELTWEGTRRGVVAEDRLAHVRSYYREQAPNLPSHVRDEWDGNALLQEQAAERIAVADSTPVFARSWLAGRCAAVSPFDPEQASDGTAQRVALVSLEDGAVVGRIAFGEPGRDRLLWLSATAILTRHVDSLGVQSIRYFPLPEGIRRGCRSS